MPRARTGQLVVRNGIWHARVRVTRNGKTTREWYTLDTPDHATAERRKDKLVRDLAAGHTETNACAHASAPDAVSAYAASLGARLAEGDHANLKVHILPILGQLALDEVKPVHVKSVRDKVIVAGARRGTVGKVLGAMRRLFAAAVEDELLEHNPAIDVRLPKQRGAEREIVKPRVILTDEEIGQFLASEEADLELRMLSLVARCEGGMRTSDLHAWDWTHLDLVAFGSCTIPRSKTAAPEMLDVPEMLRPFLRAWWERAGKPIAGPVFPVRKGERAGERKARANSYAKRLRRDMFRAGVVRLPPIEVPLRRQGQRTDLGKRAAGTMLAPNPRDPLYFETTTSLPVDFHSFRRAFNTALADAGVNLQKAMHLAGHSDPKTHMKYVKRSSAMKTIPEAALPRLVSVPIRAQSGRRTVNHRGSEGEGRGDHDGANSDKTSVLYMIPPSPEPKARGSNPLWRAARSPGERGTRVRRRADAPPQRGRRRGHRPSRNENGPRGVGIGLAWPLGRRDELEVGLVQPQALSVQTPEQQNAPLVHRLPAAAHAQVPPWQSSRSSSLRRQRRSPRRRRRCRPRRCRSPSSSRRSWRSQGRRRRRRTRRRRTRPSSRGSRRCRWRRRRRTRRRRLGRSPSSTRPRSGRGRSARRRRRRPRPRRSNRSTRPGRAARSRRRRRRTPGRCRTPRSWCTPGPPP